MPPRPPADQPAEAQQQAPPQAAAADDAQPEPQTSEPQISAAPQPPTEPEVPEPQISAEAKPALPKPLGKAARPGMVPAAVRVVRKPAVISRPRPAAAHMPNLAPSVPALNPAPEPAAAAAPVDEMEDFMSSMREMGAM